VPATFDLSAYAGKTIGLRFRYRTDGAAQGNDPERQHGLFIDDLKITAGGDTLLSDGAENPPNGWTLRNFTSVPASVTTAYDNYYVASYRAYVSYDKYLKSGPYNFGYMNTRPDWVEHFPYQNGLLVSYWDSSQTNNNITQHPGAGLILPIDANPNPLYRLDGRIWPAAINSYDAPFGLERSDTLRLHTNGRLEHLRGQNAQPLFDDTRSYWVATSPYNSVKTPGVGVRLRVTKQTKTSMTVRVGTSPQVSARTLRSTVAGR
jgi:immune inhibitor A